MVIEVMKEHLTRSNVHLFDFMSALCAIYHRMPPRPRRVLARISFLIALVTHIN